MMDWLVVIALNYADGGADTIHTPVPSKAACEIVIKATLMARIEAASAPFLFSTTCVDLKNAKISKPDPSVNPPGTTQPAQPTTPAPSLGVPGTE